MRSFVGFANAQAKKSKPAANVVAPPATDLNDYFKVAKWRNIGPFRGGRLVTASGVVGDPYTYFHPSIVSRFGDDAFQ